METSVALHLLRIHSWQALRSKIDEQTSDSVLGGRLRDLFEEEFRYDENGTPRVWKPDDDIDVLFRKARDHVLDLIPLYGSIHPQDATLIPHFPKLSEEVALDSDPDETNPLIATTSVDADAAQQDALAELDEFDLGATLTVFSEARTISISQRFRKEADAYYVEAKRSMVSSISQIPYWIYGVIAVLGWNELVAVLRNPVYTVFLIVAGVTAFVVHRLGLEGPLFQVLTTVGKEVHSMADSSLRAHFAPQTLPEPPHAARTNSSSSSSPTKRDSSYDDSIDAINAGTSTSVNGTTAFQNRV